MLGSDRSCQRPLRLRQRPGLAVLAGSDREGLFRHADHYLAART